MSEALQQPFASVRFQEFLQGPDGAFADAAHGADAPKAQPDHVFHRMAVFAPEEVVQARGQTVVGQRLVQEMLQRGIVVDVLLREAGTKLRQQADLPLPDPGQLLIEPGRQGNAPARGGLQDGIVAALKGFDL